MRLFSACLLLSLSLPGLSQYSITGQVNLGEEWQPKVYMAAVDKLNDYYRASPELILNTAEVDSSGHFTIQGDNLPKDERFYRLYLMKNQNTDYDACLYIGGDDHNFVHVLMRNGDSIEVQADSTSRAPFGNFTIKGDAANQSMRKLSGIVYPSFYFYRIKFPTELKFSQDKFHQDLRSFADTCQHSLVALAAVNNMDFDEFFDQERPFFEAFGERLQQDYPKSVYTRNYLAKLRYYADSGGGTSMMPWMLGLLGLFLALAVLVVIKQRMVIIELRGNVADASQSQNGDNLTEIRNSLTRKEEEILLLIHEGNSNKDIAQALFVEVSTVKTHINKLYSKIGASNRSEAQSLARQLFQRD